MTQTEEAVSAPAQVLAVEQGTNGSVSTRLKAMILRPELKWIVPMLGVLGLLVHFWRIGYAPSLSLADLGTVLGALLLFSVYALLLIIVLLLVPAALFGYWIERHLLPPPIKSRPPTKPRKALRSLRHKAFESRSSAFEHAKTALQRRRVLGGTAVNAGGMLLELTVSALVPLGFYIWIAPHLTSCSLTAKIAFWGLFGTGILLVAFGFHFPEWRAVQNSMRKWRRRWVRIALLLGLYLAFWPTLLVLLLGAVPTALAEAGWPYLLMTIVLVLMLHFSFYAAYRMSIAVRLTISLGGLLMVFAYSQVLFAIVDSAVNRFGFGMMRDVEIVMTKQGCDIANAAWPNRACRAATSVGSTAYHFGKVDIFTRVGPNFLVGLPGSLKDPARPRFTIPADQILSWSRPPEARPTVKNCNWVSQTTGNAHGY